MLTESAYLGSMLLYILSAIGAVVLMNLWLLRGWAAAGRVLVTLPVLALLLTPAYTSDGGETLAPALIVSAFEWLSAGPEAAEYAVRPLLVFSGIATGAAVLIALFLMWRNRAGKEPQG